MLTKLNTVQPTTTQKPKQRDKKSTNMHKLKLIKLQTIGSRGFYAIRRGNGLVFL